MKAFYERLRWKSWCLFHGLRNFWRLRKVIWHQDDCDWSGLASFMQLRLRQMAEFHEKHGHLKNANRNARQMRICSHLLAGLDDEADIFGRLRTQYPDRVAIKMAAAITKHREALLWDTMRKHFRCWWD